jgi:hypothetical protein
MALILVVILRFPEKSRLRLRARARARHSFMQRWGEPDGELQARAFE